jgi:hypothetical protein
MPRPSYEGTQDLFDRAERAINRSKELVEQARKTRALGKTALENQEKRFIFRRMNASRGKGKL